MTFTEIEDGHGKRRVLVISTRPEEGSLPLISLQRDEVLQAWEWFGRWLQNPKE